MITVSKALLFASFLLTSALCSTPLCPKNEVFDNCAEPCIQTCDNPRVPYCEVYKCFPGCTCKNGYIRTTVGGNCVKKTTCLSKEDLEYDRTPKCPIDEIPTKCQSPCLPRCDFLEEVACKLTWCSYGCLCPENYIRLSEGGICVPKDQCT